MVEPAGSMSHNMEAVEATRAGFHPERIRE
jgi:hypothetical protein